eukprot:PITA_24834
MDLVSKCVVTEPSSFKEVVEDPACVDAMVEEYDSIVRNSSWEIVPRPEGKLVVGSRWIYKIWQRSDGLFIYQGKYAREILEKFTCMAASLLILLFLEVGGRRMYFNGDWAGSPTDRKSTSRGIFSIGSTAVSWYSRKQRSMALSSAEAEYMVSSLATCEAIWMRKILVRLFGSHLEPTVIYCDNQSCIKLSANPVFHDRSKHINLRYHHIRDYVQRRIMLLSYIPTEDQDADILTKALTRSKFKYHRGKIGVADNPYLVEREC